MTITELKNIVGQQLSRIEKNPRFYVQLMEWGSDTETKFEFGFYPETDLGKKFYEENKQNSFKSPNALINGITAGVDAILMPSENITFEP